MTMKKQTLQTQQLGLPGMEGSPHMTVDRLHVTVDRANYGVTEDLLARLKSGNKSQAQQATYFLRSSIIGFDGAEIARERLGLPDVGVPHRILLNMTDAEASALYAGIDIGKQDPDVLQRLCATGTAKCVSELVQEGFKSTPWPLQVIAQANPVPGYDTGRGGLLRRMQYVIAAFPEANKMFRDSALSTVRPIIDDIRHIHTLGIDDLIAGLAGRFAWKYEKETRAMKESFVTH